ncbi:MAG: hypothetical protein JWM89_1832 [Acidimicrobiales bacterium]|nr:hypothetical protein [Acidimicrobiales bacterium]
MSRARNAAPAPPAPTPGAVPIPSLDDMAGHLVALHGIPSEVLDGISLADLASIHNAEHKYRLHATRDFLLHTHNVSASPTVAAAVARAASHIKKGRVA